MKNGQRVINLVPQDVLPEDDEVVIVILELGEDITIPTEDGKKTFLKGTECAVLWQRWETWGKKEVYVYHCLLDSNLPVQNIGWNSKHRVTRQIRKKSDQLKLLLLDKSA